MAAENGDVSKTASLLSSDPTLVHTADKDGYTPLHRACYNDHDQVVDVRTITC